MKNITNIIVQASRQSRLLRKRARKSVGILAAAASLLAGVPLHAQGTADSTSAQSLRETRGRVVGYYTEWSTYSDFNIKNLITSGSAGLLTQIDYAFANLVNGKCALADTYADYQKALPAAMAVNGVADSSAPTAFVGNFHQLQELKKLYPKLKISISIGGGSANPADFSVVAQPANRKAFVKSCIDLFAKGQFGPGIEQPGIFDGFDIDWEYPLSAADKTNMTGLLKEFRTQMDAYQPGMVLSIASSAGSWAYQYLDFVNAEKYLDFFALMAYDFDGPWMNSTGFVAPFSQAPGDADPANNVSAAVKGYLALGARPDKIVLGMPFYGYQWTGVPNVDHGLFQAATPGSSAGYNAIVPLETNFTLYRDPKTKAPWLYDGTTFWTYDDPISLAYKATYARSQRLAGVMVWDLSGDMPNGLLLKTLVTNLK